MFRKTKFKVGDRVSVVSDLISNYKVINTFFVGAREMVVLDNSEVYYSHSLVPYDKTTSNLVFDIQKLSNQLEELKEELIKNKCINDPKDRDIFGAGAWIEYTVAGGSPESKPKKKRGRPKKNK